MDLVLLRIYLLEICMLPAGTAALNFKRRSEEGTAETFNVDVPPDAGLIMLTEDGGGLSSQLGDLYLDRLLTSKELLQYIPNRPASTEISNKEVQYLLRIPILQPNHFSNLHDYHIKVTTAFQSQLGSDRRVEQLFLLSDDQQSVGFHYIILESSTSKSCGGIEHHHQANMTDVSRRTRRDDEEDESDDEEDDSDDEEDDSDDEEDDSDDEEDDSDDEEDDSGSEEDDTGVEEDNSGVEEDNSGGGMPQTISSEVEMFFKPNQNWSACSLINGSGTVSNNPFVYSSSLNPSERGLFLDVYCNTNVSQGDIRYIHIIVTPEDNRI